MEAMFMKKLLSIFCVLVLIAALLCGCAVTPAPSESTADATTAPTTTAPTTAATTEATTTAPTTTAPTTVPPTTTEPPIVKESSFTLSAVGDMLMHMPVVNSGYYANTNSYNLDTIFTYFTDHVQSADFAVGNLETTLAGTDNGYNYSGYPQFNCPDAIIDSMKTAGFDLVLTANNHSYDTGE